MWVASAKTWHWNMGVPEAPSLGGHWVHMVPGKQGPGIWGAQCGGQEAQCERSLCLVAPTRSWQ